MPRNKSVTKRRWTEVLTKFAESDYCRRTKRRRIRKKTFVVLHYLCTENGNNSDSETCLIENERQRFKKAGKAVYRHTHAEVIAINKLWWQIEHTDKFLDKYTDFLMYVNNSPCSQCSKIIRQFCRKYPSIHLEVVFSSLYNIKLKTTGAEIERRYRRWSKENIAALKKLKECRQVNLRTIGRKDWPQLNEYLLQCKEIDAEGYTDERRKIVLFDRKTQRMDRSIRKKYKKLLKSTTGMSQSQEINSPWASRTQTKTDCR